MESAPPEMATATRSPGVMEVGGRVWGIAVLNQDDRCRRLLAGLAVGMVQLVLQEGNRTAKPIAESLIPMVIGDR